MSLTYTIKDQHGVHFITCTVHQWVDVFTRKQYTQLILDSLQYCQHNKGLEIFAWVIMSNHLHLIVRTQTHALRDVIRDFKKFTAKEIIRAIEENEKESRKKWFLWLLKKDGHIWFWEEGYHGEEITSPDFFQSKISYIHQNPVRAGIVEKEEEYCLSSCGDYYGVRKGLLELCYA
jgi:REP element-mobilizing transposase RayT